MNLIQKIAVLYLVAMDSSTTMFEVASLSKVEGVDQELADEALSLYERMREG